MKAYAEAECRRRYLITYFGEQAPLSSAALVTAVAMVVVAHSRLRTSSCLRFKDFVLPDSDGP